MQKVAHSCIVEGPPQEPEQPVNQQALDQNENQPVNDELVNNEGDLAQDLPHFSENEYLTDSGVDDVL